MNRLFYNRVYLPGPIDNASDLGVGWRLEIKKDLSDLDLIFLDPCDKPMQDSEGCEDLENHDLRQQQIAREEYDVLSKGMHEIRCIDLRLADLCDFAIVHLDREIYSTGTHEEIALLNRRKVPILIHVEQGKKALPEWYWGTVPHQHVFGTWKGLTGYVREVAHTLSEIETYNRWRFIDYGSLYKKRTINISRGMEARVSPEDHEHLSQWKWTAVPQNKGGQVWRAMRKVKVGGKWLTRYMHQEVAIRMFGAEYEMHLDHKDRDPLNNERENIRLTTRSSNQHNRGMQVNNTSGVKGIWTRNGWYMPELMVFGVKHRLGKYRTMDEAKEVRDNAGRKLLGVNYHA